MEQKAVLASPPHFLPPKITFDNYVTAFTRTTLPRYMVNSFVVAVICSISRVLVACMSAFAFSFMEFKGKKFLFFLTLSTMMIPPDAVIIPKYVIFKAFGITDSMWSIVLPSIFDVFFVFMVRQFFLGIPETLSEAAIIDGCGHFKIYSQIVLPLAKPAVITMILFTFIWAWNDYMGPYIFITTPAKQMLSVGIKMFQVLSLIHI